jgi:hypothetical protein
MTARTPVGAVLLAAARNARSAAGWALGAALLVAAAPVTVVAAASVVAAWLGGWPPGRLYRAAAWCLPMVAAWLAGTAVTAGAALPVATAPYLAWLAMWRAGAAGHYLTAAVLIAPPAIPLGLVAAGFGWAARIRAMASGAGGRSPAAAAVFDRRQWRHQARAARARLAAPGAVPLTTRSGEIVAGAVIRAIGHPARDLARLPYQRMRSHQVVLGSSGTGKTTLLLRLWAAFTATALARHADGHGDPPLLVVLDCKGGADARRIADRFRRVLRDAGARYTAVWPDEATLSLWALPPHQLVTTLVDLIEHGRGAAAYYADVLEAVVALAVEAPCGPPAGREDFLGRLDLDWLSLAYQSSGRDFELALIRAAARQLPDIVLRYRTLFRRLGTGLDGPGGFGDADAWYCMLEGTAEISVAEAQARALVDLLASYVTRGSPAGPGRARAVLLAVDEFSAVARRLPIWELYERARSLGLAVQVSAQSWHGLAPDEDQRRRIADAADGGFWLLRTPHPEPAAALAGQRSALDTTRRLIAYPRWGREGSSRPRPVPVVDPSLIRRLDVGQAAYIYRGGVTFVQVKRLVAGPAALPAPAGAANQPVASQEAAQAAAGREAAQAAGADRANRPAGAGQPATASRRPAPALPDISPLLDEAFGPPPPAARRHPAATASPPADGEGTAP